MVICNEHEGAWFDAQYAIAFLPWLGFDTWAFVAPRDAPGGADEVRAFLEQASVECTEKGYDIFMMAVSSHGCEGYASLGGDRLMSIADDLIKPFAAKSCPGLAGKPKVFVIGACRGDGEKSQDGAFERVQAEGFAMPGILLADLDKIAISYQVDKMGDTGADDSDTFVLFGTQRGYVTWKGYTVPPFILCMARLHQTHHLTQIAVQTNKDVFERSRGLLLCDSVNKLEQQVWLKTTGEDQVDFEYVGYHAGVNEAFDRFRNHDIHEIPVGDFGALTYDALASKDVFFTGDKASLALSYTWPDQDFDSMGIIIAHVSEYEGKCGIKISGTTGKMALPDFITNTPDCVVTAINGERVGAGSPYSECRNQIVHGRRPLTLEFGSMYAFRQSGRPPQVYYNA